MPYRLNPFTGELDLVLGPGEGTGATDFQSDSGSAVPTGAGVITMAGGTGINTSASGSTVTFNLDDPVIVDNGGTGRTSLTDGAILVGDGSNPVELIGPLTDGQLLIGDTAGVSPVAATLTSTGSTITITNGAGSINLETSSSVLTQVDTDSGTAIPSSGILDIIGGDGIDTEGATNVVTINQSNFLSGSASITGAITGDIITFSLGASAAVYRFIFKVAGRDTSTGDGLGYTVDASAKTDGASATMIQTPFIDADEDSSLEDALINVVASGNNIILQATGVAGQTISYVANGTYIGV